MFHDARTSTVLAADGIRRLVTAAGPRRSLTRGAAAILTALALLSALATPAADAAAPAPVAGPTRAAAAPAARVLVRSAHGGTVAPATDVPTVPAGSRLDGPLAPATPMHLTVVLRPADPAGLAAYAAAVSKPGSATYHRYLSVAGFAARFSPSRATVAAVEAGLRRLGLRPGAATADRLAVPVVGTARSLGAALGTRIVEYRTLAGRVAYSNTTAPRWPASLAPYVGGVVGLDTLVAPRREGFVAPVAVPAERSAHHVVTGGPTACAAAQSSYDYTADQLATAYGFSSAYGAGDLGAGQTVALFELEPNLPSDIAAYQACYGTQASVSYTEVDGGQAPGPGSGEAALDIENVIGLAPKANVIVYQGPDTNSGGYDTLAAIIDQDRAKIISTSWGLCEGYQDPSYLDDENTLFEEAAVQGQTVLASAGDAGSEDCGRNALGVDDPASQPYVTGVGGTTLSSIGAPPVETVWNESANRAGATGGGVSSLWPMPAYQAGAAAGLGVVNTGSSATACGQVAGSYCREVPDVSADADPYSGYSVYWDGRWVDVGGTSASAPLWAALIALTDASASCAGTPVGFANPALYAAASGPGYHNDFHDITIGNNDYTGTNGGLYPSRAGYDMATGLGTPNAVSLIGALCHGGTTTNTVTVTNPGARTSATGAATSLAVTARDSVAGEVLSYSATGLPAGLGIASSSGVISGTPTRSGTWAVTVTVTDQTGATGTTVFSWKVMAAALMACPSTELVANPNFAQGTADWRSAAKVIVRSGSRGLRAHSGGYLALLGGLPSASVDTLAQAVRVPAPCRSARVSFWLRVVGPAATHQVVDTLSVRLVTATGRVWAAGPTYTNLQARPGWVFVSFTVAVGGAPTLSLQFDESHIGAGPGRTIFAVDSVSMRTVATPARG